MQYDFLLYLVTFGVCMFVFSVAVSQRPKSSLLQSFLIFTTVILVWLALEVRFYYSLNEVVFGIASIISMVLMLSFAVMYLNFVYALLERKRDDLFNIVVIINYVALVIRLVVDISPGTPNFWRGVNNVAMAAVMPVFFSVPALTAIYLLILSFRKTKNTSQKRLIIFNAAVMMAGILIASFSEAIMPLIFKNPNFPSLIYAAIIVVVLGLYITTLQPVLKTDNSKAIDDHIKKAVAVDALTLVYSRYHLIDCYGTEGNKKFVYTAVFIDIDDFKKVNDTYGHPVGDEVLKSVAKVISNEFGEKGKVFRYGGEEFLGVLENYPPRDVFTFVDNIRKQVAEIDPASLGIREPITISLGIYTGKAESFSVLIYKADQAMYTAKRTGKNRTVVYDELTNPS